MISANDIRKGTIIKLENSLYIVLGFSHVKPGKGGAFVKVKLRNLDKGTLMDNSFRASEKIEDVSLEHRNYNFSYKDNENYIFMDNQTYEQHEVHESLIGAAKNFLVEGMDTDISLYEDRIVEINLPAHVVLKVTYTEPGLRGDTATSATKPATLETGYTLQVPLFVNQEEMIKVDTRSGQYVERAKGQIK